MRRRANLLIFVFVSLYGLNADETGALVTHELTWIAPCRLTRRNDV